MGKKDKKEAKCLKPINPRLEWEYGKILGKGSFGEVYLASNASGELTAAKVCPVKCEGELDDMRLEAEILISSNHVNVLKAHSCYHYNEEVTMILELCSGGSLEDINEELQGFEEPAIVQTMYQCMNGLSYLHRAGVIHRDIKAGNIMLTEKGICKLADFGVSAKKKTMEERRNTFIGTPYWMAPEVISTESCPNQTYDEKADIWSMGVTVIEMAEGMPPDTTYQPMQVLLVRLRMGPPKLKEPEKWSEAMNNFCVQTLLKDTTKRPSADQCLQSQFLTSDDAKNMDKLVEVYNIYRAIDTASEEVVDKQEDNKSCEVEIDIDDSTTTSSSPQTTSLKEDSIAANSTSVSIAGSEYDTKMTHKTIKKTIKYFVDGKVKTKTILKVVDEENKGLREKAKSMRDQFMKEMKVLKMEEARGKKKMEESQEAFRSDLLVRQKFELENIYDKLRAEKEAISKNIMRDFEKKNAYFRGEQEKYYKKAKSANDKEKKAFMSISKNKSKSPGKYDVRYSNPKFIEDLQVSSHQQWLAFLKNQSNELCEYAVTVFKSKHDNLRPILMNAIVHSLSQKLDFAQIRRSHIIMLLGYTLQQKKKSDAAEISIFTKNMAQKKEELKRQHNNESRDLPKLQRSRLKKALDTAKKSLKKSKHRNEKEVLAKVQDDMVGNFASEAKMMSEKHAKEMAEIDLKTEQQTKDLVEYQCEKSKAMYLFYQGSLLERTIADEVEFKECLINAAKIKEDFDKECEEDLELARDTPLEVCVNYKPENF